MSASSDGDSSSPDLIDLLEVIRQEGGKWCVRSKNGSNNLGCYDTKAEAETRLGQIEYFKRVRESVITQFGESFLAAKVPIWAIEASCPSCAEKMRGLGLTAVSLGGALLGFALAEVPQDPSAVCGTLWFQGTEEQRGSFSGGTEARGTDERPPKAWWDDCVSKISESVQRALKRADQSDARELRESEELSETAPMEEAHLIASCRLVVLSEAEKTGRRWEVVVIEAGMSKNNIMYRPEVLKAAAPLFEGIKVYEYQFPAQFHGVMSGLRDHPDKLAEFFASTVGSFANLVGILGSARWDESRQAIVALLEVVDPQKAAKLKAAYDIGGAMIPGLSIRALGPVVGGVGPKGRYLDVQHITSVKAVDIVDFPAAGGQLERLVASQPQEDPRMKRIINLLRRYAPKAIAENSNVTDPASIAKLVESAIQHLEVTAFKEAGDMASMMKGLSQVAALLRDGKHDEAVALVEEMSKMQHEDGDMAPAMKGLSQVAALLRDGKHDEAVALVGEMLKMQHEAPVSASQTESEKITAATNMAAQAVIAEAKRIVEDARRDKAIAEADARIATTKLHEAVKADLRESVRELRAITPEAVQRLIERSTSSYGKVVEAHERRISESARAAGINVGLSSMDKLMGAMLGYFGVKADETRTSSGRTTKELMENVRPFVHIREPYLMLTGDESVSGNFRPQSLLVDADLRESISVATMPNLVLDALSIRIAQEYRAAPQPWRRWAKTVPVESFLPQHITRWGGFGSLPTVAENANYTSLVDPGQEQVTYTPTKKGALIEITREWILNNQDRDIRAIPVRIARAANRTLMQFTCDLLLSWDGAAINAANIYDGTVLYTAGHLNTDVFPLSYDNLNAAINAMISQTELSSGEPLMVRPWSIIVPIELRATAESIILSKTKPGTLNDVNSVAGQLPSDALTVIHRSFLRNNVNNWYVVGNPADGETMEIGFVEGNEDPVLLLQDGPTLGNMFNRDAWTYKVRHEYSGAVTDFRAFFGAIVP